MKPKTLLVLLALVGGLGAFVWLYEKELPSSDERAVQAKKVLLFEPSDVESFSLERGGESVRFARSTGEAGTVADGAWRLEAPRVARADEVLVDELLSTVAGLEKVRTLEGVDAQSLGLRPARGRLTLQLDGEERILEIGAQVPASNGTIVSPTPEGPYFVVENDFTDALGREAGDWRSRDVLPALQSEIERVVVSTEEQRLALTKRGNRFWIEEPFSDLADRSTMNRLLDTLTALEVEEFVDDPSLRSELGLEPPNVVVEAFVTGTETPFSLELGNARPAYEEEGSDARRLRFSGSFNGQLFHSTGLVDEIVNLQPVDWRSFAPVAAEVYQIDGATVTTGGTAVELARQDGQWLRDGVEVPFGVVSDFLYDLVGVRGEGVVEEESDELEPVFHWRLDADGETEQGTVHASQGGIYPTTVEGRDVVLALSLGRYEQLRDRWASVLEAEETAPANDAREVVPEAAATDAAQP